ncbi:F-box domain containing protein [Parasponia andersonii]|uniref:F-box domain containing protein n=1 Tax=Parasponia andersonii TaxID=3476 RepID=A0A2P5CHS1_PARAD|nr:F-box domain containing protein [Parasponia andersonii]
MTVDWTQLPPELVESISKNLTIYADYLRFRVVCRSWRSSVPKTPNHLPPQLPWLMLPHSHHRRPHRAAFFNLSHNKVHLLNLPEASSLGKRCCGSCHGWLVILDETPSVLLLNPLTRSKLHLPPVSTFPNVLRFAYSEIGREYALRSASGEPYTLNLRQIRDSFVKKVILSSSPKESDGFVALAILNQTGDLAFCKDGDQSWTFIEGARSYSEDAVYCNGLFYAVNKYGAVAVCDVRGSSPNVSIIETPRQLGADMQYLVSSGNELLLVSRYLDLDYVNSEELYRTVGFDVFRMDWSGPRWDKVKDLGDRMLFIGQNSSLSLSASDFPGCFGNCIYFTDDYSKLNYESVFGECDSGIFRLWDRTIEGQWNSHCTEHWPTLVWVSPNPC